VQSRYRRASKLKIQSGGRAYSVVTVFKDQNLTYDGISLQLYYIQIFRSRLARLHNYRLQVNNSKPFGCSFLRHSLGSRLKLYLIGQIDELLKPCMLEIGTMKYEVKSLPQ